MCHYFKQPLCPCLSSEQESSEDGDKEGEGEDEEVEEEEEVEKEVRPETLTPEELEKLKEAVDDKKKLIQALRGKPWPMKKKHSTLRSAHPQVTIS